MSNRYNFKRKTIMDYLIVGLLYLRVWNKNQYLRKSGYTTDLDTYILRYFRQKNLKITSTKHATIASHESNLDGVYIFGKVRAGFDDDGDLQSIDIDGVPADLWVAPSTANYIRYKVVKSIKHISNKKDEELKEKLEATMVESVLEMSGL